MNQAPYMTQLQMQQRRKLLAKLVMDGQRPQVVADRFHLSLTTVKNACREHGVVFKKYRRGPSMGLYA